MTYLESFGLGGKNLGKVATPATNRGTKAGVLALNLIYW
jgi:hypothetical protein